MTIKCKYCSAMFWKAEIKKSGCCHNVSIVLSPLSEYNRDLKQLLLYDSHFRHLIRYYNNLFCFATFSANVIHEKQKASSKTHSSFENVKTLKDKNCDNVTETSYFGKMTIECKYCSAMFRKEKIKKSGCCHNSSIVLSPLSEYNRDLKQLLFYDSHFRHLIRYYNNLFCFATFSANVIHEKQKAVYNLKIQ
ncbi:hypothetical protein TSAR_001351, partial [Trichomalopsis sarcophagae]